MGEVIEYYTEWHPCPHCPEDGSICFVCLGKGGWQALRLRSVSVGDATHHEGDGSEETLPSPNTGDNDEQAAS